MRSVGSEVPHPGKFRTEEIVHYGSFKKMFFSMFSSKVWVLVFSMLRNRSTTPTTSGFASSFSSRLFSATSLDGSGPHGKVIQSSKLKFERRGLMRA